ncbi:MAG: hypothetical protein IPP36_11280 [Nitrosomonadales bacterium]|nr:hypothetical protein [Nitrosomonadales bacterium]
MARWIDISRNSGWSSRIAIYSSQAMGAGNTESSRFGHSKARESALKPPSGQNKYLAAEPVQPCAAPCHHVSCHDAIADPQPSWHTLSRAQFGFGNFRAQNM